MRETKRHFKHEGNALCGTFSFAHISHTTDSLELVTCKSCLKILESKNWKFGVKEVKEVKDKKDNHDYYEPNITLTDSETEGELTIEKWKERGNENWYPIITIKIKGEINFTEKQFDIFIEKIKKIFKNN